MDPVLGTCTTVQPPGGASVTACANSAADADAAAAAAAATGAAAAAAWTPSSCTSARNRLYRFSSWQGTSRSYCNTMGPGGEAAAGCWELPDGGCVPGGGTAATAAARPVGWGSGAD